MTMNLMDVALLLSPLCHGCSILEPQKWPAGSGNIILTFDDGPNPQDNVSNKLLHVLKKHQVKGVFCYIGKNMAENPAIVEQAYADAHQIVGHTYTHTWPLLISEVALAREIKQTEAVVHDIMGEAAYQVTQFRPPLGLVTASVHNTMIMMGLDYAYLTFYVNDAPTTSRGYQTVMEQIKTRLKRYNGGAIVLHERRYKHNSHHSDLFDKSWLPSALDDLIQWGKSNGFRFVQYPT